MVASDEVFDTSNNREIITIAIISISNIVVFIDRFAQSLFYLHKNLLGPGSFGLDIFNISYYNLPKIEFKHSFYSYQ